MSTAAIRSRAVSPRMLFTLGALLAIFAALAIWPTMAQARSTVAITEEGKGTQRQTSPPLCQHPTTGTTNGVCTSELEGSLKGTPITNPDAVGADAGITGTLSADYKQATGTPTTYSVPAEGSVVLTDADGSTLSLDVAGTYSGNNDGTGPTTYDGTFTVTGGTSRFAGATGSGDITAISENGEFTATLSGTLSLPNVAPVANDDAATVAEDGSRRINVLANDDDPDGALDPSSVRIVNAPQNGTATANDDGMITYTPDPNFNGKDSFVYEVCDNDANALCDTARVGLTVRAINDKPVARRDTATTDEDKAVTINVRANDEEGAADESGQSLTVVRVSNPEHGTATITVNGNVRYKPDKNFNGKDTFRYQVCDDGTPAKCDVTTVVVAVNPVAEPEPEPQPTPECTIKGTSGDDAIQGTDRRDVICGYGGDDAIQGMGGNDLILGGGGGDSIQGGKGDDTLKGQEGNDTLQGQEGNDKLYGGNGTDVLQGGEGKDTTQQ